MEKLINYFIKNPKMSTILVLIIFLYGILSLQSINSTTDPKIDPRMVSVDVTYPGASPYEVEQSIILKIENNLQGIQGIRKVSSTSYEDGGNILVNIAEKFDTDQMLLKVKNVVDGISTFPVGMEKIRVTKTEFTLEAVTLTLVGDVSLHSLLKEARIIENDLLAIKGISNITWEGLPKPEIEISLNENKLRAFKLSFTEYNRENSLRIFCI